ncbi:MAG: chromosome segregation protein SMC, partial [Elusimicrobia bacterium]|nr:chromosome segregation protein SMC [Elusimicrobiota bacterium]
YAIIDQGGVDFVIKAKPEERRALFEEAAGVSKYKAKREEALRKLERVEADLARLNDSMALINEQIRKLDSDARKAKLYQKYKDELLGLEVSQILAEVSAIAAEVDRESARIAPVREAFEASSSELHAEEGRLAALALERTEAQAKAAEAGQALAEVKAEISRLEERLANNAAAVGDLSRRDAVAEAELARDAERLAQLEPELAKAEAGLASAAGREAAARQAMEDFEAASAGLDAKAAEAVEALEALRARARAGAQAAVEAAAALAQSESRLSHLDLELRQALRDLGRQTEKAQAGRVEVDLQLAGLAEAQLWLEDSRRVTAALTADAAGLAQRKAALDEEVFQARTETVRLKAVADSLQAQGSQDPYWAGAHAVVSAGIPGVLGTVRSLIAVDEADARPIEDVLGERLFAVVCEDAAAARAALELLEGTGKGRARILVLSSVPEASTDAMGVPPEAKPLLAQVRCEPRFEPALKLLLGEAYALGGAVYGRHWIFGGAPPAEGLNLKLADLQAIQTRIAEGGRREEELAAQRRELDAAADALSRKTEAARSAHQDEQVRVRALDAVRREREETAALAERDAELYREESMRLLARMAELREALRVARESLEVLKVREAELRRQEAEGAQSLEGLKAEAGERRLRRQELGSRLGVLAAERQLAQKEFDARVLEKESLESSAARRRGEREELGRKLAECAAVEAQAREATATHQARRGEVEAEVRVHAERMLELDGTASALEGRVRELKARCAETQDELHQWEVQASGLKARADSLKGRLWDEWQLPYEEAAAKFAGVAVDADRVQSLRKRIQNMGNINMAAPEEYEALTQKHGFLKTQVDDLAKAKDDLREAIQRINATTRENFRQTFTEVREHFRRIYGSLFEGGEADVVLTLPDNMLETGIEIVAQPPGKRLQSISLLSGGEKTLTAIALLFAFFMVRPSPVCMLDEADAALDEANTDRFASMLKEFAGKTQFIIVSHSKRTIEAAEQIYGVTMEEGGISQVISVDFRRRGEGAVAAAETAPQAQPEPQAVETASPEAV